MEYQIKDIKGFPGYRVDTDGNVWTCWRKGPNTRKTPVFHKLKNNIGTAGYLKVTLRKNNKSYFFTNHALVLRTFINKPSKGVEVCHNNGIKTDNRLENLRWDTTKGNIADKEKHGTLLIGEKVGGAKLKNSDLPTIWELLNNKSFTVKQIGSLFNVGTHTIYKIKSGVNWRRFRPLIIN